MTGAATAERTDQDLGSRVRALRVAAGRTIKEVALQSGISSGSISRIENNRLSPTCRALNRLLEQCSVSADTAAAGADASPMSIG